MPNVNIFSLLYYLFIPFSVSYFSIFVLRKLAIRFDIVDVPGRRKIHKYPTPLLGGMAIFLGIVLVLFLKPAILQENLPIFLGATLMLMVNLIDDIKDLSANFRFMVEVIITLGVILLGVKVSFLPSGFWGDLGETVITIMWLIGITNAFNYLDGIDGLAAGLAAISAFFFSLVLFNSNQFHLGIFVIIFIAACLGFLPHNFKKEKMFLGDAGSTFIGFTLACIALMGNWAEDNIVKLVVPILILGVPIFDMVFTTIMRIKEKKVKNVIEWLKYSGKDHFHHRLIDLGFGLKGTMFFIFLICISFGISAIMVSNEKAIVGFLSFLQASIIFAGIGVLMVMGRRHSGHLHR